MIQLVRTFTEGVKQRRRFELALVFVIGLLGFAMSGTGPDPNYVGVQGPNHTTTQETTRAVRVVIVAARVARRAQVVAPPATPARQGDHRPRPPAPAPVRSGRVARLPARVRGPPSPIVHA
jgi:hypothetical protein